MACDNSHGGAIAYAATTRRVLQGSLTDLTTMSIAGTTSTASYGHACGLVATPTIAMTLIASTIALVRVRQATRMSNAIPIAKAALLSNPTRISNPGRLTAFGALYAKSGPTYSLIERRYIVGHSQSFPAAPAL